MKIQMNLSGTPSMKFCGDKYVALNKKYFKLKSNLDKWMTHHKDLMHAKELELEGDHPQAKAFLSKFLRDPVYQEYKLRIEQMLPVVQYWMKLYSATYSAAEEKIWRRKNNE